MMLLVILWFCAGEAAKNQPLDIVINVPINTPAQDSIFITGNLSTLCSWKPRCLKMKSIAPGTFAVHLDLPTEVKEFQFKATRGAWNTEASGPTGHPLPNFVFKFGQNQNLFVYSVVNWVDQKPLGITGDVQVFKQVYSPQLGNFRNISVWLPPGYKKSPSKYYPVIYMHDGQNLFDPSTSSHGVDWGVDETMTKLIGKGLVPPAIVVGIDSTADRMAEYDYMLKGQLYSRFLLDTVKPMIDKTFRTLSQREQTFVMGSSMGGHISISLVWYYPEVFSRAAALSLPVSIHNQDIYDIIAGAPKPKSVVIYMDHGTYGWDASYGQYASAFYQKLLSLGFNHSNLFYKVFHYANHSEEDWARRVSIPLQRLLTKKMK